MFEVYICLFKVYRGVQGVKGSFTFTLTVFEVEIASRLNQCVSLSNFQNYFVVNTKAVSAVSSVPPQWPGDREIGEMMKEN